MAKRKAPVSSVRHKDKRKNIPTEELRGFVTDEAAAAAELLYARDPSLDPQLVWRGKDEEDRHDLAVAAPPIFIQEKIHPQAIIDDLKAQSEAGDEKQPDLFSDFNGIVFEDLVEFYQHEQNWSNRMILGDSLNVMGSLAEKEGLRGKVQMIFMDPPYGIKFSKNWQISTRTRAVSDTQAAGVTRQPEQMRAFRDTWKLGIHSYLSSLRERLVVAHDLLTDTGSIFLQIGIENVHLVRNVLDEVFGADNFVSLISFATTSGFPANELARGGDYLLWYGKNREAGTKYRQLYRPARKRPGKSNYRFVRMADGSARGLTAAEIRGDEPFPKAARLYAPSDLMSQGAASEDQTFEYRGRHYEPLQNSHWKAHFPDGMRRLARAERIHEAENSIRYVRYADDFGWRARTNLWTDTLTGQFTDAKIFVVQTNTKVVERCMLMTTDPGDLVLDPTCGSGTTAYVAEQWGRRWITMDTSRVALALARTRLMSARFPYYLLSDSPEGARKEAELRTGSIDELATVPAKHDVRKGFVYRRAPHITLGEIARNPEIDEIFEHWWTNASGLLQKLNAEVGTQWEEWQVPPHPAASWSEEAKHLHGQWSESVRERWQEIDASIARVSENEVLHDQPYEDSRRVRVTGPFTVESLSPHRMISADDARPASEERAQRADSDGSFEVLVIEHLRKSGVQNTKKGERLKFDHLEPRAGTWIHAAGEYTDKDGVVRRIAVSIGPEHGTVSPTDVKEAAKQAVEGIGYDTLVVCGFAFDPHVAEEAKRYGKLTVLPARMDLSITNEQLKNTGAGNLFVVLGEPDLELRREDGQLAAKLLGLDIYDPTTGQVRSSSTKDIAAWFIDTNYNGESFFVRHAYFTGGGKPYEQLQRALKAEINHDVWSSLYSDESRRFPIPVTGKIAVKVINHYGDEVLKVYDVASSG